jgi:biopolymer transport protein ExbB
MNTPRCFACLPSKGSLALLALLIAGAATPLLAADGPTPAKDVSIWSLITQGGVLMVPIGLCSLAGLAYALDRFLNLRIAKIMPPRLVASVEESIGRKDYEAARQLCRKDPSPFAQILLAGLRELGLDWTRVEDAAEDAGIRELAVLKQNVRPLRVISEIAPLLGLLGTIQGMMGAFQNISTSSGQLGKTEMFAGDIFLALVTTAAGLVVAIPALFLSFHFSGRIDKIALVMDRKLGDLLGQIRDHGAATPTASVRGTTP